MIIYLRRHCIQHAHTNQLNSPNLSMLVTTTFAIDDDLWEQ